MNVYVVRRGYNNTMRDSKPCIDCYKTLKQYNVRWLIYSNEYGVVEKVKFNDFIATQESLGRKFIAGGMVPIYRDKKERVPAKRHKFYADTSLVNKKHHKYINIGKFSRRNNIDDYLKQKESLNRFLDLCNSYNEDVEVGSYSGTCSDPGM